MKHNNNEIQHVSHTTQHYTWPIIFKYLLHLFGVEVLGRKIQEVRVI